MSRSGDEYSCRVTEGKRKLARPPARPRRGTGALLRRLGVAVWLASLAAWPAGAAEAEAEPAPDGANLVREFLAQVVTLSAQFKQTLYDPQGGVAQESRGQLEIKRPGRFRWDYSEPFAQLIVADGARVWMYDQDLEQVTVRALDDTLASTPAALLSGSGDISSDYQVRGSYEAEGIAWVVLGARDEASDFDEVRLGFAGGELRFMLLEDTLDQVTQIELSDLVRNPSIDDARFAFVPPAGVDVIGEADLPAPPAGADTR